MIKNNTTQEKLYQLFIQKELYKIIFLKPNEQKELEFIGSEIEEVSVEEILEKNID